MSNIELRRYQEEAINAWFEHGKRGIFQMATGTGKTFTAIGALDRFLDQRKTPIIVIVGVPFTHLAQQWAVSLGEFGFSKPHLLYGSRTREWKSELSRLLSDLSIGIRTSEIVISTHATMSSSYFYEAIQDSNLDAFLIADEVHGLGSPHQKSALIDEYDFRLGLSATPRRYYDEEGTEFLLEYFGDIVYEYSLADAIPQFLVPYDYYPVVVEMTADELDEYRQYSQRLGVLQNQEEVDEEVVQRVRIKRAKIVKSAENKYSALLNVLDDIDTPDHLLVYTNHQQIDHVQKLLNDRGVRQHKFTARESDAQREELLERFQTGELDALVAMKCLDEGVDVPSTRQAIMMSNSGNRMQFVQRRGRVLRRSPGKDKAEIYDFIVVPSLDPDRTLIRSERTILQTELRRFEEFVNTARNESQARNRIQPVRRKYEV